MNEGSRPHHQNVVAMTQLLEQAIARLKTLPADEQDAIAALIMEALEDDRRWDEAFLIDRL